MTVLFIFYVCWLPQTFISILYRPASIDCSIYILFMPASIDCSICILGMLASIDCSVYVLGMPAPIDCSISILCMPAPMDCCIYAYIKVVSFGFKAELLRTQPCWFAHYQGRAETD